MKRSSEVSLLLAVAAASMAALFIKFDTGANWFFWGPVFDAGHYPLFFLLTLLGLRAARFLPTGIPDFLRLPYLPLSAFVVLTEVIQPFFKRSASLVDIQNGLLGIAAAGVVWHAISNSRRLFFKLLVLGFAGVLILPLLWPARGSLLAIQWRKSAFPLLAEFSEAPEALLWGPLEPERLRLRRYSRLRFVRSEALGIPHGLEVCTRPGYFAGTGYSAGDMDWSHYQYLEFRIFNPQPEAIDLLLRIDDASPESRSFEGRFNTSIALPSGLSVQRIALEQVRKGPRDRELQLEGIRALLFFRDTEAPEACFIIDSVRLTR